MLQRGVSGSDPGDAGRTCAEAKFSAKFLRFVPADFISHVLHTQLSLGVTIALARGGGTLPLSRPLFGTYNLS
jgi:hypothetical protein